MFALTCCGIQLVGADSTSQFKHNIIVGMIEGHLTAIRNSRMYKDAMIYIFIEANYLSLNTSYHIITFRALSGSFSYLFVCFCMDSYEGRIMDC